MKKFIKACLILLIFAAIANIRVGAVPVDATMIIANPLENMNSEMNISWHTQVTGTFVQYTKADDANFTSASSKIGTCSALPFEGMGTTLQCKASLTALDSDTDYIYRVGATLMSPTYGFKTGGAETFSFMHVTDIHSYIPIPARVTTANAVLNQGAATAENMAFALFSGDSTAYGTVYDQWLALYGMDTAKTMPYVMAIGNHDYYNTQAAVTNASYFNAVTNNPANGAAGVNGTTYFFKYGKALFISLNSEAAANNASLLASQQTWFREVVNANPAEFIIVFSHRPFYTGDSLNASQAAFMRTGFQSLFDECGVDLVLSGHNHVYARSYKIQNGVATVAPSQGTTYITGNQIGDRYAADGTPMTEVDFAKGGKIDGGTVITISGNVLSMKLVTTAGDYVSEDPITHQNDAQATIYSKANVVPSAYESSLQVAGDPEDFSKATVSFANTGVGRINKIEIIGNDTEVLHSVSYPVNQSSVSLTNLPAEAYEYEILVKATLRSGEIVQKSFNLINEQKRFGTITNLRIADNVGGETCFYWDSDLVEGKITKFELYLDGALYKEALPAENFMLMNDISPYEEHEVVFKALHVLGDIAYTETLTYGTDAPEVLLAYDYPTKILTVGDKFTPTYVVVPAQELDLEFASSDPLIATVDENGEITAVSAGTVTITMNVVKRWSVTSSIEITVNPESEPEPEPEKKGCFSGTNLIWSLSVLGAFVVLNRKRK